MSPFNESLGTGGCVDAGVELVVKWMYSRDLEVEGRRCERSTAFLRELG